MISNSFQLVEELVEPLGDASLVLVGAVAGEEHIDRAGIRLELQILGRLGVAQAMPKTCTRLAMLLMSSICFER